jgi:hypothetical protein
MYDEKQGEMKEQETVQSWVWNLDTILTNLDGYMIDYCR